MKQKQLLKIFFFVNYDIQDTNTWSDNFQELYENEPEMAAFWVETN